MSYKEKQNQKKKKKNETIMSLELRKNRSLENITFLIDEIQSIKPTLPCFG